MRNATLLFSVGALLSGCATAARIDDPASKNSYLSAPHADIREQFNPKNSSDAAFEEASKPERISVRGRAAVLADPTGRDEVVLLDPPQRYEIKDRAAGLILKNLAGEEVHISGIVVPEKHPETNRIVLKDVRVEPAG